MKNIPLGGLTGVGLSFLLVLNLFSLAWAQDPVTATRNIDSQLVSPGAVITVTVDITTNTSVTGLGLDEDLPQGWDVTPVSDDGATKYKESEVQWLWLQVDSGVTKTVVYEVSVPGDESLGEYYVTGEIFTATFEGSVTGDTEVEVAITHTLEILTSGDGTGTVTKSPDQENYKQGSNVTLTANPGEYSYFVEWSGDISGTSTSASLTMNSDKKVTATFETDYLQRGSSVFRVAKSGDVLADGRYYGSEFVTGSADLAERINVSEPAGPGDVLVFDPESPGEYRKSNKSYSSHIAGVVSTSPGLVLSEKGKRYRVAIALVGTVPVKVTDENGAVNPGDLLTSSSKPGYAMKCKKVSLCSGAIIGKALEGFERGIGKVQILIVS